MNTPYSIELVEHVIVFVVVLDNFRIKSWLECWLHPRWRITFVPSIIRLAQHRLSDLDKLSLIGVNSEQRHSMEINVEIESIHDTQYRQLAKSTTYAVQFGFDFKLISNRLFERQISKWFVFL